MDDILLSAVEQEAKSGSPSAACNLGNAYRVGEGVEKNERTAADWYIRATLAGSVDARGWLGKMMNAGRGVPEDPQALCADLKARADSGDGAACCLLGIILREGWGCEKDYDTANAYFMKGASELGHLGCVNNVGFMHNYGFGFVKDAAVGVEWQRKAAQQGDASAQSNLGNMYLKGTGVPKDETIAVEWLTKAAEQGYAPAQFNLAFLLYNGLDKNPEMAAKWYRKAAEQGHASAQHNLGIHYRDGIGVPQDKMAAVQWFMKAAEQGDAPAQNKLGLMFYDGAGVDKNPEMAATWFRKAAEQGNAYAQYNLALHYRDGIGVPQDKAVAVQWFTKAAEQGSSASQYNLALMIYEGAGVDKNPDMATEWFRKAAEQGYAPAQCELAIRSEAVIGGLPRDKALAIEWYRKAIEQGDLEAHFRLGFYYYRGVQPSKEVVDQVDEVEGWRKAAEQGDAEAQFQLGGYYGGLQGKENLDIAATWYNKAAEGGNVRALRIMANHFSEGWRPDADYPRAIAWYMRAAEQGDYRSCFSLGDLYREGKGVQRDLVQAEMWGQLGFELFHQQTKLVDVQSVDGSVVEQWEKFSMRTGNNIRYCLLVDIPCDAELAFQLFLKAAEQGHVRSMYMLGICYQNGRGVEENQKEAFRWLLKAAENQSVYAQLNVGLMYQRGLGVERNEILALQWLQQAADNGHAGAQCQMGGVYRLGQGIAPDAIRALEWYEKARAQRYMRVLTPRRCVQEELLVQWYRTAMDLFRAKRYAEAVDALEKSIRHPLNKSEEPYPPSAESIDDLHVGVNPEWNRCAAEVSSLRREGKLEEAQLAARQALKLAEALGESGLSDVATSLNILGEVYFEMNDLKMAHAVLQRALGLRVRTLGRHHPEVAECLHNIAASLKPTPLDEVTRKNCRSLSTLALRIRVKAYGRNHPLVALSLMALAMTHLDLGDHDKSFSCARNAADIFEKTLGSSHVHTQVAREYISAIQADLDQLEEMIRLEKEDPLDPDDVAGQIYRWSSRSPRLAEKRNGEEQP